MAQSSWPHNAHNSRNVTDAEYEQIAKRFSDDGVEGDPTDSPTVTAGSGLQVLVKAGKRASVRGHAWYSGGSDVALSISSNSSGSTRVDRVVLRLDRADWTVNAVVREGTPGAGAPSLVRQDEETGLWEILLADVTVTNGASSVTVTDRPKYIGSRIAVEDQGKAHPSAQLGQIAYRPNTGEYRGHTGSGNYVSLYSDSGELSASIGFTDRWDSAGPMVGRNLTGNVYVQINVKRKGITFSEGDDDGSHLATIPSALRPSRTEYFTGQFTGGTSCRVEVRTNGEIWAIHPTNNVGVGRIMRLTMTWLKP